MTQDIINSDFTDNTILSSAGDVVTDNSQRWASTGDLSAITSGDKVTVNCAHRICFYNASQELTRVLTGNEDKTYDRANDAYFRVSVLKHMSHIATVSDSQFIKLKQSENQISMPHNGKTFIAFGDSQTTFRGRAIKWLHHMGINAGLSHGLNMAQGGSSYHRRTAGQSALSVIPEAIDENALSDFDFVFLNLAGLADSIYPNGTDIDEFRVSFASALDIAINKIDPMQTQIRVSSPVAADRDNFTQAFSRLMGQECRARNIPFYNSYTRFNYDPSRRLLSNGTIFDQTVATAYMDRQHLSSFGAFQYALEYGEWLNAIARRNHLPLVA